MAFSSEARRIHRRMHPGSYNPALGQPMAEMNITPLIDVMLVLLVMVVLSVPLALHKVEVDLPQGHQTGLEPVQIALEIAPNGSVTWNGEAVDRPALVERFAAAAADPREPVIRFHPDGNASYDASVQVINLAGDAGIDRFAFEGNHLYREFDGQ